MTDEARAPVPIAQPEYSQTAQQKSFSSIEQRLQDQEQAAVEYWRVTTKKEDETRSTSDTLAADAELFFAALKYRLYRFRFVVWYTTAAAADFKFSINGPGSPSLVRLTTAHIAPGGSAFAGVGLQEAFGFGPSAITAGAGGGYVVVEGLLQNGANDGGVAFEWAQNTSDAGNTIVRAGSYVQYTDV